MRRLARSQPKYRDMDWRLRINIASRSLLKQDRASIQLRLQYQDVEEGGVDVDGFRQFRKDQSGSTEFQMDSCSLHTVIRTLEDALKEADSPKAKRLTKQK